MKRAKKRILGFFGLSLVAAMTFVAALMPGPEASALTSITDTLQIRVVGSVPNATFAQPSENITTTNPEQWLSILYENVTSVKVMLSYTDKDDETHESVFAIYDGLDYYAGQQNTNLDLSGPSYGYGKYVFSLYGVGYEGSEVPLDSVSITYLPIIASASQNEDDGLIDLMVNEHSNEVETVEIYVDGELIKTAKKDELDNTIKLSLGSRKTGDYNLLLVARDSEKNQLHKSYKTTVHYDTIYVPDTGRFFRDLNISREDYLVTGLIIFFIFGIVAFGIVAKGGRRQTKVTRKKH